MRNLIPLLAVFLIPAVRAEEPRPDAKFLRDYAETRGFTLGRPGKPKFTPDGKAVLFLRSEARVPRLKLFEFDIASGKTRELLTPEQLLKGAEENLTPEEKARRERQRVSVGGFTDYQMTEDGSLLLVPFAGKLYTYDRAAGKARELGTGGGTLIDPKFSPDGKKVAYVLDFDVHVYDLVSDRELRLTHGGTEKKPHGLAEFIAQEEMYRYTGYWWSPDSRAIAYQETDHDGVEVWYVADPARPGQPPSDQYYPRPGKKNAAVRVGVVALPTSPKGVEPTTWLEWDDKGKYEYLAQVRWEKPGLMTVWLDRKQQNWTARQFDPATGKQSKSWYTRRHPSWIDIDPTLMRSLPDGSWLTRDHKDLLLLDVGGAKALEIRLAPQVHFRSLLSIDEKGTEFAFTATPGDHADELHVYRHRLPGKGSGWDGPKRLTTERGQHSAVFSPDHSLYALHSSTLGAMPRTTIHKIDGTILGELPSVAEEPPKGPEPEFLKVGDGDGFFAAVVRPRDFDPKKKYPVVVYVYGGPHSQVVLAAQRSWLLPRWIADHGFIVVSVDNRGTPGRGLAWEYPVYEKFGSVPLEDQVKGLEALGKKFPEMDLKRVGVYGWSFGGYMAAQAVLKRPDVYAAAVAGAPVTDWEDYDTCYTERYLGLLPENRKVYESASLLPLAKDLKRPLLLIHGTADDNVFFRHSLRLADALFRAGKDFDILPLPGLTHMVPDPVVTERMYGRIARFFRTHLGEPVSK